MTVDQAVARLRKAGHLLPGCFRLTLDSTGAHYLTYWEKPEGSAFDNCTALAVDSDVGALLGVAEGYAAAYWKRTPILSGIAAE